MKRIILGIFCSLSLVFLSGCCMNDLCDPEINFKTNDTCTSCNRGCNTCGYDAGYAGSAWF